MYNKELKNRFVEKYDILTQKTYISDLKRISDSEEIFQKDLFNFTYEQIDEALKGLQFKKLSSVLRAVSTYRMYSNWANSNGFVPSKASQWDLMTSDKLEDYVWEHALKNSYITREQLYNEIVPNISNSVDYIPILLDFEGIYGAGMYDMRHLKYSDINFDNNTVRISSLDSKGKIVYRTAKIDERTILLLKDAQNDTIYKSASNNAWEYNIIVTPYVVRKTTKKKSTSYDGIFYGNEPVTIPVVETRFNRVFRGNRSPNPDKNKKPLIDGFNFLNATNVFKSGYFDYCLNMENKKGELEISDYEKACVRFGINPKLSSPYKKQYLNWRDRMR